MTFEEAWKALEEKDTTGAYKQAREISGLSLEQLEYAYNSGYAEANIDSARPQGEWEYVQYDANPKIGNWHCSNCRCIPFSIDIEHQKTNFCPNCGARMI